MELRFLKPTLFASLFFILFGQDTTLSQDDPFDPLGENTLLLDNAVKQIRVQIEWIEMTHEKMTELMSKNRKSKSSGLLSANDQPLRDEITELVKKKEAKVIETMMVLARFGERAKIESIQEFIYPTEWLPADIAKEASDEKDGNETSLPTVTNPIPAAFETRNLGSILEVDPLLGADDTTIDLSLAPELVYMDRFESYSTHENGGDKTDVKVPIFYTTKITSNVTLADGQPTLVGAVSPRNTKTGEADADRKILIFVKGNVIITGAPVERK